LRKREESVDEGRELRFFQKNIEGLEHKGRDLYIGRCPACGKKELRIFDEDPVEVRCAKCRFWCFGIDEFVRASKKLNFPIGSPPTENKAIARKEDKVGIPRKGQAERLSRLQWEILKVCADCGEPQASWGECPGTLNEEHKRENTHYKVTYISQRIAENRGKSASLRASFSRSLKNLEEKGIIERPRPIIRLLDNDRFRLTARGKTLMLTTAPMGLDANIKNKKRRRGNFPTP